jgi:probable F420-dependent oxidoreductase
MTPFFDPGPSSHGPIPIYMAGVGPRLSRVAGQVADGFHVHPFHTTTYLDTVVLPAIAAGAAESGREPGDVRLASTVFVVTGTTAEEMTKARAYVAQQIAFYASTPSYRPVLEAHGWDIGSTLTAMSRRGEWEAMAQVITDDILEEVAVVAPLDELGGRLRERYAGRLDRVGYYSLGGDAGLTDDQWRELIETTKS